jgi:hypothetical protein
MGLRLATLKAISFYLLHNVSTLNQCRKLSCGTFVCKHFASYRGYAYFRWNLIRYAKGAVRPATQNPPSTAYLRSYRGDGMFQNLRTLHGQPFGVYEIIR